MRNELVIISFVKMKKKFTSWKRGAIKNLVSEGLIHFQKVVLCSRLASYVT